MNFQIPIAANRPILGRKWAKSPKSAAASSEAFRTGRRGGRPPVPRAAGAFAFALTRGAIGPEHRKPKDQGSSSRNRNLMARLEPRSASRLACRAGKKALRQGSGCSGGRSGEAAGSASRVLFRAVQRHPRRSLPREGVSRSMIQRSCYRGETAGGGLPGGFWRRKPRKRAPKKIR
jgi:hypothetical protein